MTDNLTPEQRARCMSRVRSRDTRLERTIRSALHRQGLRFRKHSSLPGRPDAVFSRQRVAIFIDGDFWHGYRFPVWQNKLPAFWKEKIEINRARDRRNFAKLRRSGWRVLRVWQHEAERDLDGVVQRVHIALAADAKSTRHRRRQRKRGSQFFYYRKR